MFTKLGNRKKSFWTPTTIGVSIVFHVLLVAGAYAASKNIDPTKKKQQELVDFMEVEEEKKEEPKPEPPKPEPEPPKPEAPPPVVKGFQEIVPPVEPPKEIPEVDPNQVAVKAEDFSGLGKAGGVAEGTDQGVAQDVSARETPPDEGTYDLASVDEQPGLNNRTEVQRFIERNYPPLLRDAGIAGTVTLRMRINEDGRVDGESITVENATHDGFADTAKRAVERMRFRPAKVNGKAVKVWVTLPVTFQLSS